MGDPRGIGPEVIAKAADRLVEEPGAPELVLVGPEGLSAPSAANIELRTIGRWGGTGDPAEAGRLAGGAIEAAAGLALSGEVDGLVTAPIDKAALHRGGYRYAGHTEMLADLAGATRVGMLMAAETTALGGPLRVLLATTHIPLVEVPRALSLELLVEQTILLGTALRAGWGIPDPAIALCGVNPHASDGGLFGNEEARFVEPAVESLRRLGWQAWGPVPADTVFVRAIRGDFDAVLAPYHDVGMAAFKTASFGSGVNVTLGLPFVRTSPDHGTAMDIAGRGTANEASMLSALRLAARLACSPLRYQWR